MTVSFVEQKSANYDIFSKITSKSQARVAEYTMLQENVINVRLINKKIEISFDLAENDPHGRIQPFPKKSA